MPGQHRLELVKVGSEEATYKRKPVTLTEYQVLLDGQVIGRVRRALLTRERRTKGRTYVDARWQSPGWVYTREDRRYGRAWDALSRKNGVERLLMDSGLGWSEAEKLAMTVAKVR